MSPNRIRVKDAIWSHLCPGTVLRTPDDAKGKKFHVESIGPKGIKVDKLGYTLITWDELEGVVDYLRGRGWVKIGASKNNVVSGDTIEGCLRRIHKGKTMKSPFVAPVLEAAGIAAVDGSRPNKMKLRSE